MVLQRICRSSGPWDRSGGKGAGLPCGSPAFFYPARYIIDIYPVGYYSGIYLIGCTILRGPLVQNLVSTSKQLALILRGIRKTRGLSQEAAGKKVGLLPKTISALENHPESSSIESLFKLLSALDLELLIAPKEDFKNKTSARTLPHEDW